MSMPSESFSPCAEAHVSAVSVKPLRDNAFGAEPTAMPALHCDDGAGHCQLCGDDAVIGAVISIDSNNRSAVVAFEQTMATVALDLIDANVGDRVLVHMGFAIERVATS